MLNILALLGGGVLVFVLIKKLRIDNFFSSMRNDGENSDKEKDDCNEEMVSYSFSCPVEKLVVRVQSLDNVSDDSMLLGEQLLGSSEQRAIMADISYVATYGKEISGFGCIKIRECQEYCSIELQSVDVDADGRAAPILIFFNKDILSIYPSSDAFISSINSAIKRLNRNLSNCSLEEVKIFVNNF